MEKAVEFGFKVIMAVLVSGLVVTGVVVATIIGGPVTGVVVAVVAGLLAVMELIA